MTHAEQPISGRPASQQPVPEQSGAPERLTPERSMPEGSTAAGRPGTGQPGPERGRPERPGPQPSAEGQWAAEDRLVGDPGARKDAGPGRYADEQGAPGVAAPRHSAPGQEGREGSALGRESREGSAIGLDGRESSVPGQDIRAGSAPGQDVPAGSGPGQGVPQQDVRGAEAVPGAGTQDDAVLRPDERDKLQLRLQQAVGGFVDEPRAAVEEAASAVDSLTEQIVETLEQRRGALRASWQGASGGAATEDLRMALREYRRLAERLLSL
ncbi:hypothetical protein ACGFW5_11695 [Streptomyces sp. NPDC048416]|uniref:hypothetical protein n=1 Tax=Streptomyces sp. NPDC048416 TaxID=3365546 RepID=UPI00371B69BF